MPPTPYLRFTGDDSRAEAVALLLHGGRPDSFAPVRAFDSGALRMLPFGRSVVRAGRGRIMLATLRYAVRGWNGEQASPVSDARWALDRIAQRYGDLPVGLVGHSMGGRVALRIAGHPGVRSVAALAPWLPPGEPDAALADRKLFLAHGTADRTTDPRATFKLAERLRAQGVDVELVKLAGGRHSMLFPARPWHDLVAGFMLRSLLTSAPGDPTARPRH